MALRETRRIEAEYIFDETDVFNYRKFYDGIAAALAIAEDIPFRDVDGRQVKKIMCMRGAEL